ncbi:MAG TPA: hypothetical protein VNC39_14090 [Acidocella sp.]|uniref:hypothetical protein n=1 Tax=Acidocella sp. TaxID=50710 RepID=UPI002C5B38B5|nr:hypothetical protein [Acidocella sp.]HVE23097.1 hypothetical protein [Acidocella sp.]
MTKGGISKSLKDQNRWQLWLTIALNACAFYTVVRSGAISVAGWKGLFTTAANLLPVGFAFIVTTVANGLLSADVKARLVFLRWTQALPGHRAFSKHAPADPRIDLDCLKKSLGNKLPEGPEAENKLWYRIFKEEEAAPEIQHIHREFLLMRDYAGFSALFLGGLGVASFVFVKSWEAVLTYCVALLLQFIIVRHVAATYGARFVCTVLAVKSAKLAPSKPRASKATKPARADPVR